MSQARHTSLSLRTQLSGISTSLKECDPKDHFAIARVAQQLGTLSAQLEKDQVDELAGTCALAARVADELARDGKIGPEPALGLIRGVVEELCETLGVERQPAKQPAAEAAAKFPQPSKLAQTSLRMISNRKLGEIMLQMSMLSPAQVEQALAHQRMTGCRFGEALVQMRLLPRDVVEGALRIQNARRTNRDDPWRTG